VLSRSAPKVAGAWRHVPWDARTLGEWKRELDGAAGLVNLGGGGVDCIKTPIVGTKSSAHVSKARGSWERRCVRQIRLRPFGCG
jgi:hypothetical protein